MFKYVNQWVPVGPVARATMSVYKVIDGCVG